MDVSNLIFLSFVLIIKLPMEYFSFFLIFYLSSMFDLALACIDEDKTGASTGQNGAFVRMTKRLFQEQDKT